MRARVRRFHSPDVDDIESFVPEAPSCFALLWQVIAGPADSDGEESFDIEILTPSALASRLASGSILSGRHKLFVFEYDYDRIASWITKQVENVEAGSWSDVAGKVARIGLWEFEDYAES